MVKKVTIQDIAAELDLSRNTVAKALMNSDIVAYDTRIMVIRKAWELGYQKMSPSLLEEYKLKPSDSEIKNIAVLATREVSVFWNSVIVGISDELNNSNCRMRFNFIGPAEEAEGILPADFNERIDGIILMSIFKPSFTEVILKYNVPTVFLDSPLGAYHIKNSCDCLVCEGRESVKVLTRNLIEQGLKKIGFIGDITYCESFKQRFDGFCEALAEAGIEQDKDIVFTSRPPKRFSDDEVESIIRSFKTTPEALVCQNDDVALKCLRALKKLGLRVPFDIAVTGFDNEEALTQIDPKLTTVSIQSQKLGVRLVRQLLWRMDNKDYPQEKISISTVPIFRKSSQKVFI